MKDDTEELLPCDSSDETTSLAYHDTYKNTSAEVVLFRLDEADEACRVCLKSGTIPIFSSEDLSEDLNHFTGIDVKPDDCFPQYLCCLCRKSLDAAIALRKVAQKSDWILRKQLGEQLDNIEEGPLYLSDKTYHEYTMESNHEVGQTSDGGSIYLEYAENEDSDGAISERIDETLSNPETTKVNEPDDEIPFYTANPSKNKFPQCEICMITFRTIEQVEDHSPNHIDVIVCEVCKNIVPNVSYQTHLYAHKMYYKQKLQRNRVECTICNKFIRKTYLKRHIRIHDSTDTVACSICEKTLKKKYLYAHMQRVHSNKANVSESRPFKTLECPGCSRRVSEANYEAHVTSHRAKIYVCEECGKELSTQSSYATHLLTHRDEYNFKCDLCPYRGKHKGLLRSHMRTHTKDYSYKCDTCNACFSTSSNLTSHKKIHSFAQFVCPQCGKCFAREKTLLFHKISMHDGIKAFSCDLCPKRYGKKDVLVAHKRKIHKVNNSSGLVGGQSRASYLLGKPDA